MTNDGAPIQVPLSDGIEVAARLFEPAGPVRGLVSYVHGLQSHSGWFLGTANRLADAGHLPLFADRRGAGRNARNQPRRYETETLLQDVADGLAHLRRLAQERGLPEDLPVGLIGHSLGGLLTLAAVAGGVARVDWLYLISPRLVEQPREKVVGFFKRIKLRRQAMANPDQEQEIPITPRMLTGDPEGQRFVENDEHRLRATRPRFVAEVRELERRLREEMRPTECPSLMVLAGEDLLVDNQGSEKLFRKVCQGPSEVRTFDGCGHTLELTPARAELVPALQEFLARTHR